MSRPWAHETMGPPITTEDERAHGVAWLRAKALGQRPPHHKQHGLTLERARELEEAFDELARRYVESTGNDGAD